MLESTDAFERVLFATLMTWLALLTCEGWSLLEPVGLMVHEVGKT